MHNVRVIDSCAIKQVIKQRFDCVISSFFPFIYFTSFTEQDKADINSLRISNFKDHSPKAYY